MGWGTENVEINCLQNQKHWKELFASEINRNKFYVTAHINCLLLQKGINKFFACKTIFIHPFSRKRNNGPSQTAYILSAQSTLYPLRHPKRIIIWLCSHGTPYFQTECRNFILIGNSYCRAFWKTPGEGYTPKEIHKGTGEYFNRCTCNNRLITYNRLNKYKTIKKTW